MILLFYDGTSKVESNLNHFTILKYIYILLAVIVMIIISVVMGPISSDRYHNQNYGPAARNC